MKKVIVIVSLLAAGTLSGAYELHNRFMPVPIATAVIAEKPDKVMGGQAATLLPTNMTDRQALLMQLAIKFAKQEGVSPALAQSVLLQETNAGGAKIYRVVNPGPEAYFGPMQIKLGATKDILKTSPGLFAKYGFHGQTDDEIKANLILNEAFNLEVGVKYLRLLNKLYGYTGRDLMNAYNRGPSGVKDVDAEAFHYAIGAEKKLVAWKGK